MKIAKIAIPAFFLSIFFTYGCCVGRYRWFPFEQITVIKRTLSQIKKINNYSLLAELAKTNNIELHDRLKVLNLKSSSKKSNSINMKKSLMRLGS